MNEHPAYLVYLHLPRFLESRGLTPSSGAGLGLARDQFTTKLDNISYFLLDAAAPGGRVTSILLLARGKFAEQGPQLKRLIESRNSFAAAREGRLEEVLVIAPEETLGKKNMTDVIRRFRAAAAARAAGKPSEHGLALAAHYNMHPYRVFSLDIPRAQIVPKHEVADPAAVAAFLARERLTLADLRQISSADPPVVWVGGRPGQVVRITAPSETAGEALFYCLVVPAK
jgi:DNA-directed RNA polymerase subunit H (RpoH/RPB5)